jgi:acetylornithine deacetylase/succinyl-diaminopimelate desuccinylase-like protein
MRLVPDQDPGDIAAAFERTMRQRCPAGVRISFKQHGLSPAAITPIDSPAIRCAERALEIGFGAAPTLMREGGSIPVVGLLKRQLGVDCLMVGFGLPDDRIHSPNEKFDLAALHGGTRTAAALYAELGNLRG